MDSVAGWQVRCEQGGQRERGPFQDGCFSGESVDRLGRSRLGSMPVSEKAPS